MADLPQRATVLPLHADRLRALLREPGVIDRENPGPTRHDRAEVRPHPRCVPGRMGDEVRQRLRLHGSLNRPCIAGMDFRSLSFNSPSRY